MTALRDTTDQTGLVTHNRKLYCFRTYSKNRVGIKQHKPKTEKENTMQNDNLSMSTETITSTTKVDIQLEEQAKKARLTMHEDWDTETDFETIYE